MQRILLIIALVIASLTLSYFVEHILKIPPCALCLYQRYIYIVALIILLPYFVKPSLEKYFLVASAFIFTIGGVIALYHFGVEQKVFKGLASCSFSNAKNVEDFKRMLESTVPDCSTPTKILGISMSFANFIWSVFLTIICLKFSKNATKSS